MEFTKCSSTYCYSGIGRCRHHAHSHLTSKQQGYGTQVASSLSGFAVVASQADVDWESPVVSSGDILPQGTHHLRSGVIRLELFSGVQLVVEGEAKFVIDSPLSVTLNQGAVRAYVPDVAHGFRVVTEAGKIIDYGTEFSVRVDGDTTDVTVLDGEVGVVQRTNVPKFVLHVAIRYVCETR